MSRLARDAVWEHSKNSGSALTVMLCLADHSNEEKLHKSWPGIDRIAERTRLSPRQVKRHLKDLRKLGELHVDLQAGTSRQNEYWLLLPGLPAPPGQLKDELTIGAQGAGGGLSECLPDASKGLADASKGLAGASKSLEGDTQGRDRVTSKVGKGDTDVTQTFSEPKKENQKDPLNPPKGEEDKSDCDFWMKLLTEFKGLAVEYASDREWKALQKHPLLPAREQGKLLTRFLKASPPESTDSSKEADLLRCRKRKLSSLIRHLPEMCANAARYDKLRNPRDYRPAPPPPPPLPTAPPRWFEIALALFVEGEDDWSKKYAESHRAYLDRTPWERLAADERKEIITEHERREAEKKKGGCAGNAGDDEPPVEG